MYIKNKSSLLNLARSEEELMTIKKLLDLVDYTLDKANPYHILSSSVSFSSSTITVENSVIDFTEKTYPYLISFGKASQIMVKWFLDFCPMSFSRIIIVSPDCLDPELASRTDNITFFKAGHPTLDDNSIKAAEVVLEILGKLKSDDLCFLCVSGGGSALLESPDFEINLEEYVILNNILLSCGATIQEINTIRKHFSKVKGGKLAMQTKAQLLSFIISDVIGNDPSFIASGPTVADFTTWKDCQKIIEKYNLSSTLPPIFNQIIEKGIQKKILDTPNKEVEFKHVMNFVIGTNSSLLNELKSKIGKNVEVIEDKLAGESREVGKYLARKINAFTSAQPKKTSKSFYKLFGGETTVTIQSFKGKGGRIQELILSFLLSLERRESVFLIAFGTDGIDGNSEAAGALIGPFIQVDENERKRAQKLLLQNNSNSFFKERNCEIITGYTGTNLMDVGIILVLN